MTDNLLASPLFQEEALKNASESKMTDRHMKAICDGYSIVTTLKNRREKKETAMDSCLNTIPDVKKEIFADAQLQTASKDPSVKKHVRARPRGGKRKKKDPTCIVPKGVRKDPPPPIEERKKSPIGEPEEVSCSSLEKPKKQSPGKSDVSLGPHKVADEKERGSTESPTANLGLACMPEATELEMECETDGEPANEDDKVAQGPFKTTGEEDDKKPEATKNSKGNGHPMSDQEEFALTGDQLARLLQEKIADPMKVGSGESEEEQSKDGSESEEENSQDEFNESCVESSLSMAPDDEGSTTAGDLEGINTEEGAPEEDEGEDHSEFDENDSVVDDGLQFDPAMSQIKLVFHFHASTTSPTSTPPWRKL